MGVRQSLDGTIGFSQIGGQDRPPQGAQEQNFRDYRQGRITAEEYYDSAAMLVLMKLSEFRPRPTPVMPGESLNYLREREIGRRDRDPVLHKRHGDWLYGYQLIAQDNLGELQAIAWALDRMESKVVPTKEQAREKISEYYRAMTPPEFYNRLRKVQVMDMDDKRREVPGVRR